MLKYLVNQRVKIVSEFNTTGKLGEVGFVQRIDESDLTLTYRICLDSNPQGWEWVREQDIEPESFTTADMTLPQLKAKLEEFDVTIASAQAELEGTQKAREAFLVELATFGITLVSAIPTPAPKTIGELYEAGEIRHGDKFQWIGSNSNNREWHTDQTYRVVRVDDDESVLLQDTEGNDDWAWKNEDVFAKFVKVA